MLASFYLFDHGESVNQSSTISSFSLLSLLLYVMSCARERPSRRKTTALKVPDLDEDAAERKRILNVLAQRRYRERKRGHLRKLEPQFNNSATNSFKLANEPQQQQSATQGELRPQVDRGETSQNPRETSSGSVASSASQLFDIATFPECIIPQSCQSPTRGISNPPGLVDDFYMGTGWTSDLYSEESNFERWAAQLLTPPLYPTTSSASSSCLDTNHATETNQTNETSPSVSEMEARDLAKMDVGSALQTLQVKHHIFPDESLIHVLGFNLLKGCLDIAKRMNIDDLLWSLDSLSPFTVPALSGPSFEHLPVNLRPTQTQVLVPHHPMFDILPWPTVRNKLIMVFSQPPELRPTQAAGSTAMLDLVYDIEDPAEGVRISGDDPYSNENWEVGDKVFKKWWWALDSSIIKKSNELRKTRGAALLGSGFVAGEVL